MWFLRMDIKNLEIESLILSCDSLSRLNEINKAFLKRSEELKLMVRHKRIELATREAPIIEEKYDRPSAMRSLNNLMRDNRK